MLTLTTIAYARHQNPDSATESICRDGPVTVVTAWHVDLNANATCRSNEPDYSNKAIDHSNYDYE